MYFGKTGYIFYDFCSTIELPEGRESNPQPKVWNVKFAVSILIRAAQLSATTTT
jgi:hypothetical protein